MIAACEGALNAWCAQHCGDATVAGQRTNAWHAASSCYPPSVLTDLRSVSMELGVNASVYCGARSHRYVRALKLMTENIGLAEALEECTANLSSAPSAAARRAAVAKLQLPLLHRRAQPPTPTPPRTDHAARDWVKAARSAGEQSAAADCLSHGRGLWRSARSGEAEEPYLLPTDFLPRLNVSKWWWGSCDDDIRHGGARPPRPALQHRWEPEGSGCDALRKGRRHLPPPALLSSAFCQRHRGKTVLFVGDSIQGQLFVSFAMALGVWSSRGQMGGRDAPPPRCARDRRYLQSLSALHEYNLDMVLCPDEAAAGSGVRARFIRNEFVSLSPPGESSAAAAAINLTIPANFLGCDWREAAASADLLVLNRGMHYVPDDVVTAELAQTLATLKEVQAKAGGTDRRVLYRGVHASIPSCHLLSDPLPSPFPYVATDPLLEHFHWADFSRQNGLARSVAAQHSVPFMDVYHASSQRPGGHMPPRRQPFGVDHFVTGDCSHYCIPGPLDEWVRLLLAYWT